MSESWARRLYTLAWWTLLPVMFGYLLWRSRRQPAYRGHWGERLGWMPAGTRSGTESGTESGGRPSASGLRPIWIHAVSVGETRAALPLIEALADRDPQRPILLTHTTPTGRETGAELARRLPGRIVQCYLPYDLPFAVRGFLRRWQPACGLMIETEVWPNLMFEVERERVPVALVNGRLSERSLVRGQRQRALITPALRRLARIGVQTVDDAARLERLGRPADAVCGNLKYDIAPPSDLIERGRHWRSLIGARPVIVAASTRDGEESLLLAAWRAQQPELAVEAPSAKRHEAPPAKRHEVPSTARREGQSSPTREAQATAGRESWARGDPLLIVVPRHPQRFDDVDRVIVDVVGSDRAARRAAFDRDDARAVLARSAIVLGDSMGEMPAWYALADVAIVGGSLLPFGAQNLIEANAVGCPVVIGPSTFNFAQAAAASIAAGAAESVPDAAAAIAVARAIVGDPARRERMAAAALAFTRAHRGATEGTLALIEPLLPARPADASSRIATG
ncbi:MAG: 3-deoxy-D-manno-octulosonic acid transferase [Burkholderiaceae bacterium]